MAVNVSTKYKCAECSEVFSDREAICEDWRDEEKSLICPKCHSYLAVYKSPKQKYVWYAAGLGFLIGLYLAVTNGAYIAPILFAWIFSIPFSFIIDGDPFDNVKTVVIKDEKYNKALKQGRAK